MFYSTVSFRMTLSDLSNLAKCSMTRSARSLLRQLSFLFATCCSLSITACHASVAISVLQMWLYHRTRSVLGWAHVPPTKVFRRLAVNKTILKPCVAAATGGQYVYVGFSRRNKIRCCSAYTISEKAIRFRHPDYNPDRAQKLISSSVSRHLSICNISSKSMHAFLSNLANRQTDKRTRAKTCTSSFVGDNES